MSNGAPALMQSIAEEAAPKVGFDIAAVLAIVTQVIPVLQQIITGFSGCLKPQAAAQPAKLTATDYSSFLATDYANGGGEYSHGVLGPTKREILNHSKHTASRMKPWQAETLACTALDHIRTGTPAAVQECLDSIQAA